MATKLFNAFKNKTRKKRVPKARKLRAGQGGGVVGSKIKNLIKYGGPYPEFVQLCESVRTSAKVMRSIGKGRPGKLSGEFYLDRVIRERYRLPEGAHASDGVPTTADRDEARVREDGVYVDVSGKGGAIYLGFAIVAGSDVAYLSTLSNFIEAHGGGTNSAEGEAIRLAKKLFPDQPVYCDHKEAAKRNGATYIDRRLNRLAHSAARKRKGYAAREELDV